MYNIIYCLYLRYHTLTFFLLNKCYKIPFLAGSKLINIFSTLLTIVSGFCELYDKCIKLFTKMLFLKNCNYHNCFYRQTTLKLFFININYINLQYTDWFQKRFRKI